MTAKELASILNGREYGAETDSETVTQAKENGLVIVFAYSDDNCEFSGAFDEEIPCWQGRAIFFNKDGSNFTDGNGEVFLMYHEEKDSPEANYIHAVWCENERVYHPSGDYYSWTYKTEIPHETFDIFEDGQPFCRGIVFSVNDLK